jgi:hypothetical protein
VISEKEVIRALGDLEGTVRALSSTVKDMADQWRDQEKHAVASRRILYDRVEGFSAQLGNVLGQIAGITQDVAELKNDIDDKIMPTVTAYNAGIAHKAGAMWASGLYWTFLCALAAACGYAIHLYYFAQH